MGLFGGLGTALGILNPVAAVANIGAGLLGGGAEYFSAQQSANAQRDVNSQNVSLARQQMDWQERMSSTAVQRATEDMKRAGVNPMLAAGQGESTPAGSLPSLGAVPPTIGAAASGAKDMIRLLQELKESNSRIDLNNKSGWSQWANAESSAEKNYATQRLLEQTKKAQEMQNRMLEREVSVFNEAPGTFSTLKLLNDRGIGASSAASLLSLF